MSGKLWPHQIAGLRQLWALLQAGEKRICLTSPTGGGKTRMLSEILGECQHQGLKTALYTNRIMLTSQTSGVFADAGLEHGIRAAGFDEALLRGTQICSIMTEFSRSVRRKSRNLHKSDVVFVDEAHAIRSVVATHILNQHIAEGAAVVGVTATPLGVGHLYTKLVVAGTNSELRACGALLPCVTYGPDEPDLSHVRRDQVGEFVHGDVVKAINRNVLFGRVEKWWRRLNPDAKPTLLFAPGVSESKWFVENFEKAGITAAHIDGRHIFTGGREYQSTPELRAEVLQASKQGDIKIVCNRFVLREGLDMPWLAHMIMATPFGSVKSYLQAGGRLLRNFKGLDHVILQDHGGCLDTQSEILTTRGWLGIDDISKVDVVGTMNMDTGAFEWCEALGVIRKEVDSEMISVRHGTPHLDFRVTGYHDMVMTPDNRHCKWRKQAARDMAARNSVCQVPVSLIEEVPACGLTDSELTFIGWFFTDGCMDSDRVRIYQAESSPREHHDSIVACLEGCGFRYSVRTRSRPTRFGVDAREVSYSVSSGKKSKGGYKRLTPWLDKSFPLAWFESLDRRQFGVLLHAMNLGDGCKHKGYNQQTITLTVARRDSADNIQSLAIRRGYRCNIAIQDQAGDDHRPPSRVHLLHIRDTTIAHIMPGTLVSGDAQPNERVWCVQTPNGTLICRRNGRVCVMGNSWWRHGSLNEDRQWDLAMDPLTYMSSRAKKREEEKVPEPICCTVCGGIRLGGYKCPFCGHECALRYKNVIQVDGTLKRMTATHYKKAKAKKQQTDDQKLWYTSYFAILNMSRRDSRLGLDVKKYSVRMVSSYFFRRCGHYPAATLLGVPKTDAQWSMQIETYQRKVGGYKG